MVARLIYVLFVILLMGCTSSPSVHYYVLEPLSTPSQSNAYIKEQHSIGVGPITVPTLLESKKIVTRLSGNRVQIAQFNQWASSLQDNLLENITHNLTVLQPNTIVRSYPWSVHGTVDLQIIIDIVRFDTTPGGSTNLEANWSIKNEKTNTLLKSARSVISRQLDDTTYPETVRSLSYILAQFSQELSLALLEVNLKQ
jgi:uncharacterized protein